MLLKKALLGAIAIGAMLAGSMARAENLETFRVGIIGGENEADRLRNYQCVVDQLPKVLGVKDVKLFPATDYDGVIQGLLGGTLDYAELGASGFAKIYLTNPKAVEPILTTIQTDGATGYYSIMVARKDSGIKTLADMKGKKLGFADPDSTSGYLIPVTSLPKDIKTSVKDYFSETGFGGGHENLVLAVKDGKFDAGTTFGSGVGTVRRRLHVRQPAQDGRQGLDRHEGLCRTLEVAAHSERPDRGSHIARQRPEGQVQGLHDELAKVRSGLLCLDDGW